jgi:acyl-coenzyme A synthetase/AMP-(fatty) acid ligase
LPDGNIEFLGRSDHQIKVRGFRIEPGEIETVLGQHPLVRECAVIPVSGPGGQRLVAHVVAARDSTEFIPELREYAKAKLPQYMVPAAFVELENLPRMSNGKNQSANPVLAACHEHSRESSFGRVSCCFPHTGRGAT